MRPSFRINSNASPAGPLSVFTIGSQHGRARKLLKLAGDFVVHSLRHTMLTRLAEAGVDAFTIMRIAGHSTVVVSQRYVHPSSEAVEPGEQANAGAPEGAEMRRVATISATLEGAESARVS